MAGGLLGSLALTAATVGSLHALAPDHWAPFAAVARAQRWSAARTARITVACGFGHVTASLVIALLGLLLGREVIGAAASRLEGLAGVFLVVFGLAYGAWGLRRAAASRLHGHAHAHFDHVHDPGRVAAWSLFVVFAADPCLAVIPLIVAAAGLGWSGIFVVAAVYELATIGAMVLLVLPARAGAARLRWHWLDHYGDAGAGGLIAAVGVLILGMGW